MSFAKKVGTVPTLGALSEFSARACATIAAKDETPDTVKAILRTLRPYDIRHSHATAVYRASGDAFAARELLGHRSEQTTRRYVGAAVSERVERAVKEFEKATRKRKVS